MFPELLFKGWHWLIELTPSKTGNSREKETHAARDIAIKEKRKLRPCKRDTKFKEVKF